MRQKACKKRKRTEHSLMNKTFENRLFTRVLNTFEHSVQLLLCNGGKGGIRTHGALPHGSFQDCFLKPLGHLSSWAPAHAVPNAYLIYQISAALSSPKSKFPLVVRIFVRNDNFSSRKSGISSLLKHLFVV